LTCTKAKSRTVDRAGKKEGHVAGKTQKQKAKAKRARKRKAAAAGPMRRAVRLIVRAMVTVVLILIALPVILVPIYAFTDVHPVSTLMLSEEIRGRIVIREWVAAEQMAPALGQSVIMSEDGKFCAHHGVDWVELNGVIDSALGGEATRGASTLTMQLAKNLFLWPGRNYVRKALEVPLALYIDLVTSKRRQLEIYMNIVEWGPGIYGAEAASLFHFKKTAQQLTRVEAARLAVTLPNPVLRNPRKPSAGFLRLSRLIFRRAERSGAYVGCVK
jgi:monofunctional biosynthetic peptidoglycan transglycosylase